MSKILADATAGLEYIIETGMNIGCGAFILKLIAHVGYYSGYVGANVLGSRRMRHPEKLLKAIAEWNIPARIEKLIILSSAPVIIGQQNSELKFAAKLRVKEWEFHNTFIGARR